MNLPALGAGILALIACCAHGIVGAREFRFVVPIDDGAKAREVRLQTLCGWHMVTVDLGAVGAVLIVIGALDCIPHESIILWTIACAFAAWGTAWLLTLVVSGRTTRHAFWRLPQWLLCYSLAALSVWAAS